MKLAVFHYHLRRGGVTSVIHQSIEALRSKGVSFEHIALVSSSTHHEAAIPTHLEHSLSIETVAEMNYIETLVSNIEQGEEGASIYKKLYAMLTETYQDYVWWVHNYHLGKNPYFTKALLAALEKIPQHPSILTIHDFPEDGRYTLLARSRSIVGKALYPLYPATYYHLINSADAIRLSSAGIPSSQIRYIPNPVSKQASHPSARSAEEIRKILTQEFASSFPAYKKGGPYLLYPIRTIRRKNVLEALLIASLMEENILVTLPGLSAQEAAYSQLVAESYAKGLVPGMWGIGDKIDAVGLQFSELIAATQALISSSIQEGFGYQYLHAVTAQKALIARRIPVMEDMIDLLEGQQLYTEFKIPLQRARCRTLVNAYKDRLNALPLPPEVHAALMRQLQDIETSQYIDFFLLELNEQYRYLASRRLQKELQKEHFSFIERCHSCIYASCVSRTEDVEVSFGFSTFAKAFLDLLEAVKDASLRGSAEGTIASLQEISDALLTSFADMKNISFLLN